MKIYRLAAARLAFLAAIMTGHTALAATATPPAPASAALSATGAAAGIARLSAQECDAMRRANVITERNPLPCRRLARVRFRYFDFEGRQREDGEMIVMDALAPHVQRLLGQLYAAQFPLHSARSLTQYGGDDAASMADNNSSAFNGRPITGGGGWSKHAYGAAIDINPLQNPYIGRAQDGSLSILPPASGAAGYADRGTLRPGMTETVRDLFADNGFLIWGGSWRQPIDYQHFEIGDRALLESLARSTPGQAAQIFDRYVRAYRRCVIALQPADASRKRQCAQQTMHRIH